MPHTWDDRTRESKEGIIGVPEYAVPRMRHNGFEPVKSTGAHTWATCAAWAARSGLGTLAPLCFFFIFLRQLGTEHDSLTRSGAHDQPFTF